MVRKFTDQIFKFTGTFCGLKRYPWFYLSIILQKNTVKIVNHGKY